MQYSYYEYKHLEKGQIIQVELSIAANVRLMSPSNYNNYRNLIINAEIIFVLCR